MLLFPVLEAAAAAAESLRRATPTRVMFPIRAPPLTKKLRVRFPRNATKSEIRLYTASKQLLGICYVTCDRRSSTLIGIQRGSQSVSFWKMVFLVVVLGG